MIVELMFHSGNRNFKSLGLNATYNILTHINSVVPKLYQNCTKIIIFLKKINILETFFIRFFTSSYLYI